jgi:peptidoglycan/LPS O-acetylase OafA/YrhL
MSNVTDIFEPLDYVLSRIARLNPPYLFALILTVAVVFFLRYFRLPGGHSSLGVLRPGGLFFSGTELWQAVALHDGMTGVNGPLWTLYIEVKTYIAAMGLAMIFWSRSWIGSDHRSSYFHCRVRAWKSSLRFLVFWDILDAWSVR